MPVPADIGVLVTARNEADRLEATLFALAEAFPGAPVVVADDASDDATPWIARAAAGVEVVRAPEPVGKGGAATLGARAFAGAAGGGLRAVVLCDGDLGVSAGALIGLLPPLERGEADMAIAVFARPVGGGFGLALRAARRAVERETGLRLRAPLSGQRALRPAVLRAVLPFADGFGMETAMTIDAHRAGFGITEVELPLEHRTTGRTPAGFLHRARQRRDIRRAATSRREGATG